jgi:hypothetical protein
MKLGLGALLLANNPADVTNFMAKISRVSVNIASSDSQSGSLAIYEVKVERMKFVTPATS